MNLEKFLLFLDTYKGRDRVLRLLCYLSKYGAAITSPDVASCLDNLSKQLSTSRTAFRLLDDLPTIVGAIQYGLGMKEKHTSVRILSVLSNIFDVIFCPIDHIAWAIDHRILHSKSTKWDTLSTAFWVASLYINIVILGLKIGKIHGKKTELYNSNSENSKEFKQLSENQLHLLTNTCKAMFDLIFAVHYLPPGFMWSGKLEKWQVGACGTISSAIALYQALR